MTKLHDTELPTCYTLLTRAIPSDLFGFQANPIPSGRETQHANLRVGHLCLLRYLTTFQEAGQHTVAGFLEGGLALFDRYWGQGTLIIVWKEVLSTVNGL
jgi:hypothetical protein